MNYISDDMTIQGYSEVKERTDQIINVLRDISVLVGERKENPVQLETGGEIIPGLGYKEDASSLTERAQDLGQGLFNIMVLGTFKNGKSTLLNALLGSKRLISKAAPATAIITILVRGESQDVAVYENGKSEPRILSWKEFEKEFQLTKEDQETLNKQKPLDRFQKIKYAQIECKHPLCANGVKLVDSPGLEEHVSRTKVTTNFLKQSHAVILVLDATKILSKPEKIFIEHMLGEGRLDHVFFVVNKINLIEDQEVDELKDYVKHALRHHYLDEKGDFIESLYNRRVFFVNAKGALDLRISADDDNDELEMTGIPALERELERLLTGEDKVRAALSTTVQSLSNVIGRARKKIVEDKSALQQPLERLEAQRLESEKSLEELERKKKDIEHTFLVSSETIKQKIYSNLTDYIRSLDETWMQDAQSLEHIPTIGFGAMLKATVSKSSMEELSSKLSSDMQHYVEWKMNEWSNQIPIVIERDIENLRKEVEVQVAEFALKLDEITRLFACGGRELKTPSDLDQGKVSKAIMVGIGVFMGDVSGVTGSIMSKGDWTGFFERLIQQFLLALGISMIFPPGGLAYWITMLLTDGIFAVHKINKFKEQTIENLGHELQENLQGIIASKQDEIYSSITNQFAEIAKIFTANLSKQIEETRENQEQIIMEKRNSSFSVDQEQKRLDAIGDKLVDLFGKVSSVSFGDSYSIEEIDRLATVRSNGLSAD